MDAKQAHLNDKVDCTVLDVGKPCLSKVKARWQACSRASAVMGMVFGKPQDPLGPLMWRRQAMV
jgi:hypothetical protein